MKNQKGFISIAALLITLVFTGALVVAEPEVRERLGGGGGTIEQIDEHKAKVSSNDTTEGYLNGKLVAGSNITLTELTDGGNETLEISSSGGGGGGSTALDLGDNGSNESSGLTEIAVTGDTNSIFTEPSADKLLIAVGSDWPKADTSDDLTCTDCIGSTEITDLYVFNTGDTIDGEFKLGNGATSSGLISWLEDTDNGSNYLRISAPSAITTTQTCTLENDASFIPDSCVGDGTDANEGVGVSSDTEVLFNNAGAVDGISSATFDGTNLNVTSAILHFKTDATTGMRFITSGITGGNIRDFTAPDMNGTLALGTGVTGECAEWANANTLTTSGSACGSGGAFDSTTVDATTWSDGANASNVWTFDVSGTDTTLTFGSDLFTFNGGLTVTTGNNFILGTTQWNSGDGIDGEVIANDTIDDDSIDFADVTGADLTLTDANAITAAGKIIANALLDIKNGATSSGILAIFEDSDDGTNKATFQVPALAADTVYTLPADDGDASEVLTTNGSGTLTWETAAGSGDVTAVGNCATGACFTGTSGSNLVFDNAGGDGEIDYNGTQFAMDKPIALGSAGVRLTGDGDGAITFLGLGNGSDEDLTLNLDDTSNTGVFTSSTGLNSISWSSIGQTVTIADNTNITGLTINNNDVTNFPEALEIISAVGGNTDIRMTNTSTGAEGSYFSFFHNSASPANQDVLGGFLYSGKDSAANTTLYTGLSSFITDTTNGSEDAAYTMSAVLAGTFRTLFKVGDGVNGITVGNSTVGNGVVSSAGSNDLVLQTGNATTGTCTLQDGANGDFDCALNGSGRIELNDVDIPTISSTDTLTNKTLTSPVLNTGVSGTALAVASDLNTGTSTSLLINPDALSGSYAGTKNVSVYAVAVGTALTTGDGKAYFVIPAELNGMNLVDVQATITTTSSSGDPQFDVARGRQANATTAHAYVDVLSTNITIDATEYDSKDDATQRVIDTSNDDVATGDIYRFDTDGIGTGSAGLMYRLSFRLP